jgi:hypothetical protein
MSRPDLSGEWLSRYFYHEGDSSQHLVTFEVDDNGLLVGSGTDDTGSTLILRLEHDTENDILTGTWHEQTSPSGEYGGEKFHGAVQFVLAASLDSATGKWVGFNSRRDKINVGDWSLKRPAT